MQKYQIFAVSAALLILANYWFILSSNPLIPRSLDYVAYGFFIFGIYKLFQKEV
ncbi:MAG: hypothetical protein WC238_05550 [Parcubacteria group bacterium]|jgi:hypothetical protein